MKRIILIGLLILSILHSYSQISGPSEVPISTIATYYNTNDTGNPYITYSWELDGDKALTCVSEDSVCCQWFAEGFFMVRLKAYNINTQVTSVIDSMEVVIGDPPFLEFTYDEAGNRIERELIYYSERKAGLKSFKSPDLPKEEEIDTEDLMKLYPNPSNYSISILANAEVLEMKNRRIIIYDFQGRKIMESIPSSTIHEINIENLKSGTYIVKLIYGKKTKDWKLIKY